MNTEPHDIDEQIRDWLRREIDAAGHGVKGRLAKHLGFSTQDGVTRLIAMPGGRRKRVKKFPIDLLPKLEEFFGSSPFRGLKKVPIVGLAGAGPEGTVLFATGDGNFGEVDAPLDSSPTTAALEVRGDSMYGIANDGWIIFYEDREAPSPEHMGELCVCWLQDERVLVKIPQPGREFGLFNLESANAPTMRDVPVRAFSVVTDIKTRRAAKRYVKRNPDAPVVDIKVALGEAIS